MSSPLDLSTTDLAAQVQTGTLSALEVQALRGGAVPAEMSATERKEWEAKRARLLPANTPSTQ